MRSAGRFAAYTAAIGLGITGVCVSAGPAAAAGSTGFELASMSFEQPTVDASSGGATATLDWSISDANTAAANITGEVYIQQVSAQGKLIGAEYGVSYAYQSFADVSAASGTAQSSTYSYSFTVPQYAATSTATWAVVKVTAADDQSGSLTVGRQKLASMAATSFTADELVDTVGASYGGVSVTSAVPAYALSVDPAYFDDAVGPVGLSYSVEAIDPDSGFSQGVLVLQGPGGRTISTDFAVQFDALGSTTCGPDTSNWGSTDIDCTVPVSIPEGTAAGTWVVSELKLTDAAGTTTVYHKLSLAPVVLTQNAPFSATGLTLSPTSVDDWTSAQTLTLSMTPEGAQDGIASVTVDTDGGCYGGVTTDPVVAADGSVSVPVKMPGSPQDKECTVTGVAIFDGAGDLAAYGPAFDDPQVSLVATQTPDTAAPVATSASLDTSTIAQSGLPADVTATIAVNSMVGVQEVQAGVYGPSGNWINANSANVSGVTDGTVQVSVYLPAGLAPGTYTLGFTLLDNGGLDSQYGYPAALGLGSPAPSGPLQFTVTS